MIAGPVLFLAVLLLAAAAAYLLRKLESVSALLAAGVSALLAVGLWRLPLNRPVIVAGRPVLLGKPVVIDDLSLVITPASRALVVFLLITAAITFILAWRTYQGRTFYPFGLGWWRFGAVSPCSNRSCWPRSPSCWQRSCRCS